MAAGKGLCKYYNDVLNKTFQCVLALEWYIVTQVNMCHRCGGILDAN